MRQQDNFTRKITIEPIDPLKEKVVDSVRLILRIIQNSIQNEQVAEIIVKLSSNGGFMNRKRPLGDSAVVHTLCFPGKTARMTQKFGKYTSWHPKAQLRLLTTVMLVHVLKIILRNLQSGDISTKRDVYYQNVLLFNSKQSNCDSIITMLSNSFGVNCEQLGIVASPKGLIYGNFALVHNVTNNVTLYDTSTIIPPIFNFTVKTDRKFVLLIEKEAVYQFLCTLKLKGCLMLTGKGYADKNTLLFLDKICSENLDVKVLAFVDSDPHGINILLNYLYNRTVTTQINLIHCGVFMHEYLNGWLDLKQRDLILVRNILQRITQLKHQTELLDSLKKELQRQGFLGKKCEMNLIGEPSSGLGTYEESGIATNIGHYVTKKLESYQCLQSKN